MKVCVDAREFAGRYKTGIARYLDNLLAPLVAQPGLEMVLAVNNPDDIPERLRHPAVHCATLPELATMWVDQVTLPRIMQETGADIFFSPYYKTPLTGKFKRIITVHDIMFMRLSGTNIIRKFLSGMQLRLAVRAADTILADSQFTRDDLSDYAPGAADRITVLHPSIEPSWLIPEDERNVRAAAERYSDSKPFVLYVGNFKPHKNVHLLVEAFSRLAVDGRNKGHSLVVAGSDPVNHASMRRIIDRSGAGPVIKLYGNVPDKDIKALYCGARWFITASEYEGFGYPLVEAMCCRCPVICRQCTSIPEVTGGICTAIEGSDTNAVSAAISRALNMPEEDRRQLGQKSADFAAGFASDSSSQQFRRILESMRNGCHGQEFGQDYRINGRR